MKYKVNIDGNNKFYGLDREFFEEGERVDFQVVFMTDTSTSVRTDDVNLIQDPFDRCYHYHFIMPNHDVNVTVTMKSMMAYEPLEPLPFGMMGMNMSMYQQTPVAEVDENNCLICPMCGYKNSENNKFCGECGTPLKR